MTQKRNIGGGRVSALVVAGLLVMSVMAIGVVAAVGPSDELNYEADTPAPNPSLDTDLTVTKHPMSQGTSADAMAGYYDDNGDWVSNPEFEVNTTEDVSVQSTMNKYTYDPAYVEDPDRGDFPNTDGESGDNSASILDGSEWVEDETGTAGSGTVSDTSLVTGVDGVQVSTTGQTGTDTYNVNYANWSAEFDSDESKRVLQVAGEVNSMDAGASVNISIVDESGDYKEVMIEPDATQSKNATVAYGQTSGTFYYQIPLETLATTGGGSFDNIESVDINVEEANADVSISQLSFRKKSKISLGDKAVDNADDDSNFDQRNTTYNATGTVSIHDLATMDTAFDDASLTDVTFPAKFKASDLQGAEGEEGDWVVNWDDADQYPSYDKTLNASYRMSLPAAIDLSYANNNLQLHQEYPNDRYLTLGHEEDASDTTNLSQASTTDDTAALNSASGEYVTLDSSVSSGQDYIVTYEVLMTQPEVDSVQSASGGAAAPADDGGDSGIISFIMSPLGIISSLVASFGIGRWRGWF